MATDRRKEDWYPYLFKRMTEHLTKKEDYKHFAENNISFVSFNYDRSIEHFLWKSFRHSFYKISQEKIEEELRKIKFIHIYGQVAGLEWQDQKHKIPYGFDLKVVKIPELNEYAENLKIVFDERENSELDEAHKLIGDADRIFFLGFGYARENLEVLKLPSLFKDRQVLRGTAVGLERQERNNIFNFLVNSKGSAIRSEDVLMENIDCLKLLKTYL